MNAEPQQPEQAAGSVPPAPEVPAPRLVNPTLSGTLAADHAALQNDLLQAQELAMDFQRQLAGKSNEYAQLKQILEKTQTDLSHLQEGIVELRAERHRLANEAMRATAFELKLGKVTAERDRVRNEIEVMREAMARKIDELTIQLRERDRKVAELVIDMVGLRQAAEEARNGKGSTSATPRAGTAGEPKIEMPQFEAGDIELVPTEVIPKRAAR